MTPHERERRSRDRQMILELRERLNRWDPIGSERPDEYDCGHGRVLAALRDGTSAEGVAEVLRGYATDHLGVSPTGDEDQIATELVAWYERTRTGQS